MKANYTKNNSPGNNEPYSVSELSYSLKQLVEDNFSWVRVRGEISGFKRAASGHMYFSLKDENSLIDIVCWRSVADKLALLPEDGLEVIAAGKVTTYAARSRYQLVLQNVEIAGEGALLKLLEDRKKKFSEEGLFDQSRKRLIPYLPEIIGVITSPTGAVIQDVLHRISERFPRHVIMWPVLVQGKGAAEDVAQAITGFNSFKTENSKKTPDVLIIARGGGSLEDLWVFNEEVVVRAAAESSIPIISAIGHETDVTLLDMVADLRAPTPTAAAEMAVPVRVELIESLAGQENRLISAARRMLENNYNELSGLSRGLPDARSLLTNAIQHLDDRSERLSISVRYDLRLRKDSIEKLDYQLPRPRQSLMERQRELDRIAAGMQPRAIELQITHGVKQVDSEGVRLEAGISRIQFQLNEKKQLLSRLLDNFSYERILERGFSLVRNENGKTIGSTKHIRVGMQIGIRFHDGEILAVVGDKGILVQGSGKDQTDDEQGSLL